MKASRQIDAQVEAAQRETAPPAAPAARIEVGLLTGGDDPAYAHGLTHALAGEGCRVDFVGSDNLDSPELRKLALVRFLNLRGDQSEDAPLPSKIARIVRYYVRLLVYAAVAKPRIFHILWNNKFELIDRTVLMAYYRLCGKRVVLTAHNVNIAARDGYDSWWNRLTLRVQYRLCAAIFVHTSKMGAQLQSDFGVPADRISLIPFGIYDQTPNTNLTPAEARMRLGLAPAAKIALFFGQIAPYKGLEYLVEALPALVQQDPSFVLVIAGKVKKGNEAYWQALESRLAHPSLAAHVYKRIEHVPDEDVELYFKSADVLVMPYTQIFQSGVLFLGYTFGLPTIATDVGSLREDVLEGETGFVCRPRDPLDLGRAIDAYFASELYRNLPAARERIMRIGHERHSWKLVAEITRSVYQKLQAP